MTHKTSALGRAAPLHAICGASDPGRTTPVGSYPEGVSPFGCLDMAGNVYERCWMRRGDRRLPIMIKGGSWLSPHPINLRVLDMCVQGMPHAEASVGFRCVMKDPDHCGRSPTTMTAGVLAVMARRIFSPTVSPVRSTSTRSPAARI